MKKTKLLYIIVVVGFIIRLIFCLITPAKMDLDPQYYYDTALNLAQGKGFIDLPLKPPFYSIFLSFLFKIFTPNILIIQIVQCFIDSITVFLVYLICKKIFMSEIIGIIACSITAIDPFLIYFTNEVLTETLSVFFVAMISYLFILTISNKNNLWINFLLGFFIGLSILTRGNFAGYIGFVFVSGVVYSILTKNLVITVIMAILVVSLWLYRNYRVYGEIVLAYQRGVLWQGLNPNFETEEGNKEWDKLVEKEVQGLTVAEQDRYLWKKGLMYIKQNPYKFLYVYIKKFLKFWRPVPYYGYSRKEKIISFLFFTPILTLFFLGIFLTLKHADKLWPLYCFILNFNFFTALMWVQLRYRVPIHPLLHIFAGYSIYWLYKKISKTP
ncbi:MAG: glycosyltransferase family 39 protein [candidate division WOR-3 bacterium]